MDSYDDDVDPMEVDNTPWTKTNTELSEFILWKKDTAPNKKDPRINSIQSWIDISQAVRPFLLFLNVWR